jgi:hypothetical protein
MTNDVEGARELCPSDENDLSESRREREDEFGYLAGEARRPQLYTKPHESF